MAETVERLQVEIALAIKNFKANMAKVNADLAKSRGRFGALGKTAGRIGATIGKTAKKFRASVFSMKGAILGLVTGLVIKKLKDFIFAVVDLGDQMAKTAKKIGIGVETLSGLKFAADLAGTSFQAVAGGFRRLASAAFDANEGLAESQRAFDALGIQVTDSQGQLRNLEDLFFDSADALQALTGDTERAALAQDLFGRAGLDLIPLLKQGSKEIRKQIALAKELGITFSEKDARAAEEFKDQLTILKAALFGFASGIVKEVVPAFTEFFKVLTEQFRSTSGEGQSFAETVGNFIKGLLFVTIGAVELMKTIWNGLKIVWIGIQLAFSGLQFIFLRGFEFILEGLGNFIGKFSEPFDKVFKAIFNTFQIFAGLFVGGIGQVLQDILNLSAVAINKLADLAQKLPAGAGKALANSLADAAGAARLASGDVKAITDSVTANIAAWEGLEEPAKTVLTAINKGRQELQEGMLDLTDSIQASKTELDLIAESEAIPFWERAKQKIIELNDAIEANKLKVVEQTEGLVVATEIQGQALEKGLTAWNTFLGGAGSVAKDFSKLAQDTFQQFASGIGSAFANALLAGESFKDSMKNLMASLAKSIIATLVKIIITALVARVALAFLGVPSVDVAGAGTKAGAEVGAFVAGLGGAGGGAAPFAHGGIVTAPTLALVGEAGPEAIIPLDRAGGAMGGLGGPTTIILEVDGAQLAEIVVPNMPDVLRAQLGGTFG